MSEALFIVGCLVLLVAVWLSKRGERGVINADPQPTVALPPRCYRGRVTESDRRNALTRRIIEKLPEVGP